MSLRLHGVGAVHHGEEQRKGEGREVQCTAEAAGSVSQQQPLPEADSTNSRFMALEGILRISISLKVLPLAERLGLLSPASELGAVTTWSSTTIMG